MYTNLNLIDELVQTLNTTATRRKTVKEFTVCMESDFQDQSSPSVSLKQTLILNEADSAEISLQESFEISMWFPFLLQEEKRRNNLFMREDSI